MTWRTLASAATLAEAARGRGRADRARVAGLMLDRLSLAAPRLAALPAGEGAALRRALAAPRVGLNIVDLRGARRGLSEEARIAVDRLLDRLAGHFADHGAAPDPLVLGDLDEALRTVVARPEPAGREAVLGLVGLRRALFPGSPPYAPAPITFREAAE